MHHSIFKTLLILPFLLAGAHSASSSSVDPNEVSEYWSDPGSGGGSAYLGVDTCDITADRVGPLELKEERGVEVTMVDQDAPAGKAGVREHDVILSVNAEPIQGVEQLRRIIHEIPPGRTVSLGISRNGQPITLQVQLARRKDYSASSPEFKFVMPNLTLPEVDIPASIVVVHSSGRSGLMVENLSPQLGDFFGAKDGILVRSVEKGSCADKAGFRAGDVIIRVDGKPVSDSGDFGQALRNRKGNSLNIGIVRSRKEQTLVLTLPELRHTGFDSVGMQEIGAQTEKELGEMKSKLAQIGPETELAIQGMETMGPDLEKKLDDLCRQEEEFKNQVERGQQEMLQDQERQQEEQEKLQELPRPQADI
jgi:membrane-associated protease RseP (regulator of RpoE activity)